MQTNKTSPVAKLLALLATTALLFGLFAVSVTAQDGFESLPETSVSQGEPGLAPEENSLPEDSQAQEDEEQTSVVESMPSSRMQGESLPLADGIQPASADFLTASSYDELVAALAVIEGEGDKTGTITLIGGGFGLTSNVSVNGLNVTVVGGGARLTTSGSRHFGVSGGGRLTLQNLTLDGEGSDGGVSANASSLVLDGVRMHDIYGTDSALTLHATAQLDMNDSVIENSGSTTMVGVNAHGLASGGTGSVITLRGTSAIRGCADGLPAVYIHQGTLNLQDDAAIENNGGLGVRLNDAVTMNMSGNSAVRDNRNGGISDHGASVTITMTGASAVSGNSTPAAHTGGAGISLTATAGSRLTMRNTAQVSGNTSNATGPLTAGGVYLSRAYMYMYDSSTVTGNTSNRHAGGIYMTDSELYMSGSSAVSYNRALTGAGGGIFMQGAKGRFYWTYALLTGTASIVGNYAYAAGGGVYINAANDAMMYTNACFETMGTSHAIQDNHSRHGGGGIFIEGTLPKAQYMYAIAFTQTYFSGNTGGDGPTILNDSAIIGNYNQHVEITNSFGASVGVRSKSVPNEISPYAFNNYDIGWNGGTPVANVSLVTFYVNGQYATQAISVNGASVSEPTIALNPGEVLDGWYTDENQVGVPAFKWDFTWPVPSNMDLWAEASAAPVGHTVTVNYYTQEQWYTSQNNEDKTTTATHSLTVPDGDALAGYLDTLEQGSVKWYDLHRGAYETTLIIDEVSLPATITADYTIYVVYRNLYAVIVEFYKDGEGTPFATESVRVPYGETPEMALVAEHGAGWRNMKKPSSIYHDGVVTPNPLEVVTGPATVRVVYTKGPHILTVEYHRDASDGSGTLLHTASWSVADGTATLAALEARFGPAPLNAYQPATGYHTGAVESPSPLPATVEQPFTIVILYKPVSPLQYQVTYDYGQVYSGASRYSYRMLAQGEALPQLPTTVNGYTFQGWLYNGDYWDFAVDRMPAANITLVGVWQQDTSAVTPPPAVSSTPSSETGGDGGGGTTPPAVSSSSSTSVVRRVSSTSTAPASSSQAVPGSSSASIPPAVSSAAPIPSSVPENEQENRDIDGADIPLNWWQRGDGWSLINLIVSILMLLSAGFQLVRSALANRRESEDREGLRRNGRVWLILSAITGILPIILLLILEDFAGVMLMLDMYSPWFIGFAVLHAAFTIAGATGKAKWRQAE